MLLDYHMHTYLSDGKDEHIQYANKAIELGLAEIGFSDHICLHHPKWAMRLSDINRMQTNIENVRQSVNGKLNIRFAVEMDYIPGKENEIKQIIDSLPLDYVIGAIHYIKNFNFDTDMASFSKRDKDNSIKEYFKDLKLMIKSGLFDIVAHIDLIKMFGNINLNEYKELLRSTIELVKQSGMTVELNTNGLNKPCKEFYPSIEILTLCKELGIPVTLSSDAHNANQVGQYFDNALSLLKEVGYSSITGYKNRTPFQVCF